MRLDRLMMFPGIAALLVGDMMREESRRVIVARDPRENAPPPPQEKPHRETALTQSLREVHVPLPWGSTKYQRARMRQAERLRAKQAKQSKEDR